MERINILNKTGMLSKEDRKKALHHNCQWFSFKSNIDLSDGVTVSTFSSMKEIPYEKYSQDLAAFMVWWTKMVMKDLNGFSGFGNIKFEFENFKLI